MSSDAILAALKEQMREVEDRLLSDLTPADKQLSDLVFHVS